MTLKVRLKNGTDGDNVEVTSICMTISQVVKREPYDMITLVETAREPDFEPNKQSADRLKLFQLLEQDGTMRDPVRNVVLSMVSGEGRHMTFHDPVIK